MLFEEKPDLPAWKELNLAEEQAKATAGNIGVLPEAQKLASAVNAFNQGELLKQLRGVLPNLDQQISTQSNLISDLLAGEIPDDVSQQVQSNAAARALGAGTGGSGRHGNLLARDLGLTSLGLQAQGMDSFNRWLAQGRQYLTAPQFGVSSMFVSPTQQAAFDVNERNLKWNYDWFKSQHDAQPEPWEKAVEGLLDWVANTGLSAATMGIGGIMGGMGGAAAGGAAGGMDAGAGFGMGFKGYA